jgi:hypothetical protein
MKSLFFWRMYFLKTNGYNIYHFFTQSSGQFINFLANNIIVPYTEQNL